MALFIDVFVIDAYDGLKASEIMKCIFSGKYFAYM